MVSEIREALGRVGFDLETVWRADVDDPIHMSGSRIGEDFSSDVFLSSSADADMIRGSSSLRTEFWFRPAYDLFRLQAASLI